jgi:putative Holliday junction resolvase
MSRILALDVGTKRIGIAVSDEMELTAQGVDVLTRAGKSKDFAMMREIIEKYSPRLLIVGMPLNMDGTSGESARQALAFADSLKDEFGISVETWDERLTTVSSERILLEADVSRKKRRKVIDKVAATLILQSFLDSRRE